MAVVKIDILYISSAHLVGSVKNALLITLYIYLFAFKIRAYSV